MQFPLYSTFSNHNVKTYVVTHIYSAEIFKLVMTFRPAKHILKTKISMLPDSENFFLTTATE